MKGATLGLALLVATLCAPMSGSGLQRGEAPTDQNFSGRVYDLDYLGLQGWTQVLIQPVGGGANLVAITKSELLQRFLEIALLNAPDVRITYRAGDPAELRTAVLRPTAACSEKGCVEEASCGAEEGTCSARITGYPQVKTKSPRALGILLTAIGKKKAVEYLDIDKQGFIVRVKINVPTSDLAHGN